MARITIDDDFWEMVQTVASMGLDYDKVLAQALRLIQLSQQRYKTGKIITAAEYQARSFFPQFLGILIVEIETGCLQYVHADDEFKWLLDRQAAGKKGGQSSAQKRSETPDSNSLEPSKLQANSSNFNPLTLTPSSSGSKEPEYILPLDWIVALWNQLVPSLPPIKSLNASTIRGKKVIARLKQIPDHESWHTIFKNVEASDFLSGRDGVWSGCDFDWVVKSEKFFEKIFNGGYANPKPKEVKQDIWIENAKKVMTAIGRFGDGDPQIKEFLGEELWWVAIKCEGGFYGLRRLPNQPWTATKIAGLLKASAANLQST